MDDNFSISTKRTIYADEYEDNACTYKRYRFIKNGDIVGSFKKIDDYYDVAKVLIKRYSSFAIYSTNQIVPILLDKRVNVPDPESDPEFDPESDSQKKHEPIIAS